MQANIFRAIEFNLTILQYTKYLFIENICQQFSIVYLLVVFQIQYIVVNVKNIFKIKVIP